MGATAIEINRGVVHTVEIVVHIDETLDAVQRETLAIALENSEGVESCVFCEKRFHLMLVNYDRDRITSRDILSRLTERRLHARLIGPV